MHVYILLHVDHMFMCVPEGVEIKKKRCQPLRPGVIAACELLDLGTEN